MVVMCFGSLENYSQKNNFYNIFVWSCGGMDFGWIEGTNKLDGYILYFLQWTKLKEIWLRFKSKLNGMNYLKYHMSGNKRLELLIPTCSQCC